MGGVAALTHRHGMRCVPEQRHSSASAVPGAFVRYPIFEGDGFGFGVVGNFLDDCSERIDPFVAQVAHQLETSRIRAGDLGRLIVAIESGPVRPGNDHLTCILIFLERM